MNTRLPVAGAASERRANLPRVLMIITGKGPLREVYEERIAKLRWQNVCGVRFGSKTPRPAAPFPTAWAGRGPHPQARRATTCFGHRRHATCNGPRSCVRTAWLASEDYPRLLGSADLGLCLHRETPPPPSPRDTPSCRAPNKHTHTHMHTQAHKHTNTKTTPMCSRQTNPRQTRALATAFARHFLPPSPASARQLD